MVSYLFTIIVVGSIGLIGYRMIFKKKTPSSMYTPYDDMIMGKKDDVKRNYHEQIQNTISNMKKKAIKTKPFERICLYPTINCFVNFQSIRLVFLVSVTFSLFNLGFIILPSVSLP
ncbi:DUF3951 domain-containing protein [Peribacillus sp. YIM B13482]|uniref:DUF3951 domain-containing protein n=1 Tax=Peribacillus sp. YIM B13482 TaxID=3366298 RepID=UPI0036703358